MQDLSSHMLVAALLILAGCTPAAPATPTDTSGGAAPQPTAIARADNQIINVAVGALTANPTPAAAGGYWMLNHVFDPLIALGENFALNPSVLTKWDVDAAGTTWTFTMRTDMKWPKGEDVTVDDVIFTFDTINTLNWPSKANFVAITEFKKVNASSFTATTRAPDMSIPATMVNAFLIPKGYFESVGLQGFIQQPVGSGPYELTEYKTSDQMRLTKRAQPHAFRKPENEGIVFRAVPESQQVVNGLRTGEIDAATVFVFSGEQIDSLSRDGNEVLQFPVSNVAIAFPQGAIELKTSPLKDIKVRQALNYAVNRQALAGLVRGSQPSGQFSIPASSYWDKDVPAFPYDVAKAKQLLAEAGYPNGFKASLDFQPQTTGQNIIVGVQGMLKEVGVEIEVNTLDFATNSDKSFGRNNQQKSELFAIVSGDSNGFSTTMRQLQGCGKPLGAPPAALYWCNPEWEKLMDQAIQERDATRRAAIWRQANKLQRDDVPGLYLYISTAQNVMGPKTKGQSIKTFQQFNLDSVYKIK